MCCSVSLFHLVGVGYKINRRRLPKERFSSSSLSLLFPLTSVTFKFLVVYLEDGSFVVFTIFNRSILQSVSIFLRHRVLPAVVEDTLEAHTYGSRLAAVAESNWGRTHQTHKRGDETMGLLKLSWCRVR